jgi:hypothetical protein
MFVYFDIKELRISPLFKVPKISLFLECCSIPDSPSYVFYSQLNKIFYLAENFAQNSQFCFIFP